MSAGRGADLILVQADGIANTIDCGPGHDELWYLYERDDLDVITGCEVVSSGYLVNRPPRGGRR